MVWFYENKKISYRINFFPFHSTIKDIYLLHPPTEKNNFLKNLIFISPRVEQAAVCCSILCQKSVMMISNIYILWFYFLWKQIIINWFYWKVLPFPIARSLDAARISSSPPTNTKSLSSPVKTTRRATEWMPTKKRIWENERRDFSGVRRWNEWKLKTHDDLWMRCHHLTSSHAHLTQLVRHIQHFARIQLVTRCFFISSSFFRVLLLAWMECFCVKENTQFSKFKSHIVSHVYLSLNNVINITQLTALY